VSERTGDFPRSFFTLRAKHEGYSTNLQIPGDTPSEVNSRPTSTEADTLTTTPRVGLTLIASKGKV